MAAAVGDLRRAARVRRASSPPRTCSTSRCRSACRRRSRSLSPFVAVALALRGARRLAARDPPLPEHRKLMAIDRARQREQARSPSVSARDGSAASAAQVRAVDGVSLSHRARRDGRLHRAERRRQVDDDQDADRHPRPVVRIGPGRRPRSEPRAGGGGSADRRRVRPAHPALVGPAARGLVLVAAPRLPGSGRAIRRQPRRVPRAARTRRAAPDPGAAAVARPAHARRARRRRCSTTPRFSSSTSRRSASTPSARKRCGRSSSSSTARAARRCC